jgi:hypothetical protein
MRRTVKTARLVLVGSALLLMLSGMIVWGGRGDLATRLAPVHGLLGIALAASLWTIAAAAARGGAPRVVVVLAVSWSIGAIALAVHQDALLTGGWHWAVQVLHVVTAMGMVAWGQALVLLLRRAIARQSVGSSLGSATVVKQTPGAAPSKP